MNDRSRATSTPNPHAIAPQSSVPHAAPSPPPAPPVGEENWLDYIDQQKRRAHDIESRIQVLELYKKAATLENGSLTLWLAYCEYFWSLYQSCQRPGQNGFATWKPEELPTARDIFSLDSALRLWQEGHEATQYRLSDSHELWNRWIGKEMELLGFSRTAEGVKRITHLFRNRLLIPHKNWSETSQSFSMFLNEYNQSAWESTMKEITTRSQPARELYERRDPYELRLVKAVESGDEDAHKTAMRDYLQFEIVSTVREKKNPKIAIQIAMALFSRALTGVLARDEETWTDYAVFVSTLYNRFNSPESRDPDMLQILPSSPTVLQGAVSHCPWSGPLWARYILSCEEAGLSFSAMERIKHAATDSSQLDRDGMVGVVDMYAAWCGYLKRSALDPAATEEMTDLADSGLLAALEAVQVWGERRFGNSYVGDPNFRLERILINYLTEKHGAIDEARFQWLRLAEKPLYAVSYNFWLQFYVWELSVFQAEKGKNRSPTPGQAMPPKLKVPSKATEVLLQALKRKDMDWPERILEVYLQHCNDYETPDKLRSAYDLVHRVKKQVEQRRQGEAAAVAAYTAATEQAGDSPSAAAKRKRSDATPDRHEGANKRPRNGEDESAATGDAASSSQSAASLKRDREHTTVIVTNLPADTTQTRVRQYFREYGHVNSMVLKKVDNDRSAVALVEFRSTDDARSALLRDGKYYGERVIEVKPGDSLTLFVTNYPPTADDEFIRKLFKDCGEIFDIRWPSLKFNTHRRFCYVSFREAEAARRATELDGKELQGKFKLSVKYSDPARKKAREGATSEGREVKVANLPLDADEASIKEVFGKIGTVQTVRVLKNMAGRSKGTGFVVYETKEQADQAVTELNGVKLKNNIVTVEPTKVTNFKPQARTAASPSPKPDGEGDIAMEGSNERQDSSSKESREARDLRTFALLDIPDTVNDARVRALVEKHAGEGATISKLVLRPDHGGAIVELADHASAGKAQLALDGAEIDNCKIRTGTVAELLKEKDAVRSDRIDGPADKAAGDGKKEPKKSAMMMPPPRVSRPVLGGQRPKRGGFAGLGFFPKAAVKNAATTEGTNGTVSTDDAKAPVAQKSNAQFRDMFLASNGSAEGQKDKQQGKTDKASETSAATNGD